MIKKAKRIIYVSEGGVNMEVNNLRSNKVFLKALLMKNIKTDKIGRVLLSKDDEWRDEPEWDNIYKELLKERKGVEND